LRALVLLCDSSGALSPTRPLRRRPSEITAQETDSRHHRRTARPTLLPPFILSFVSSPVFSTSSFRKLEASPDFFYDPSSKKLRKRFARYPDSLDRVVRFFDDFLSAEKELRSQIKAERNRR